MSSTLKTPASGDSGRQYVGFEEYIEYQLRVARKGIHGADLLSGIVGAVLLIAAYLFVFAVTDHWVVRGGWGTTSRYVWWGLFLSGMSYWCWTRIYRPWSQRVTQLYAASQLEHAHPELKSNLLTLIDLQQAGRPVSPVIIESMERRAATNLQQVNVDDAVDRRPLTLLSYALLAMVVVLCIYTLASPKSLMSSAWRALFPMSNVAAGTRTTILEVLPGDTTLLSHSKPDITTVLSGAIPEEVRVVFSTADRKIVDEIVKLQDTGEGIHRFRGRLIGEGGDGLLQNITYRVEAGDATSPTYSITVRQPPTATVNEVVYDYPAYMGIDDRSQADSAIDAWEGTTVTIKAQANVPIDSANIQFFDTDDTTQKGIELPMQVQDGVNLTFNQQLKFRPDGTFPRFYRIEPVRGAERGIGMALHTQRIRPDLSPKIEVLYPQGDLELPANGTLPVAYEASDPDFMLKSVVMKFEKDGELLPRQEILFDSPPLAPKTKGKHSLAMKPFGLEPGQTLVLWLEAKDNFEPFADRVSNLTRSPKITITITDPVDPQAAADQQERQEHAADQKLEQSDPMQNPAQPEGQPQEPMPDNPDQPMPDQPMQDDPMAQGQPPMPQEGQPQQEPMPAQQEPGQPQGEPQQGQPQGADGQTGQPQGKPQAGQQQKKAGQTGQPNGQPQAEQDPTGEPQTGQPQPSGGQKTDNSTKPQPPKGQPQPNQSPSNPGDSNSNSSESGLNGAEPEKTSAGEKPEQKPNSDRQNNGKNQKRPEKAAPDDVIKKILDRKKPPEQAPGAETPTSDATDTSNEPGQSSPGQESTQQAPKKETKQPGNPSEPGTKSNPGENQPRESESTDEPMTGASPMDDSQKPMPRADEKPEPGQQNPNSKSDEPKKSPRPGEKKPSQPGEKSTERNSTGMEKTKPEPGAKADPAEPMSNSNGTEESDPEKNGTEKSGPGNTGSEKMPPNSPDKTGGDQTGEKKTGTEKSKPDQTGGEKTTKTPSDTESEKPGPKKTATKTDPPTGPDATPMPDAAEPETPAQPMTGEGTEKADPEKPSPETPGNKPSAEEKPGPGKKPSPEKQPGKPAPMQQPGDATEPDTESEPKNGEESDTPNPDKSAPKAPQKNTGPQNGKEKQPGNSQPMKQPGQGSDSSANDPQSNDQKPGEKMPGDAPPMTPMPGEGNEKQPGQPGEDANQPPTKDQSGQGPSKNSNSEQRAKTPGQPSGNPKEQTPPGGSDSKKPGDSNPFGKQEPGSGEPGQGESQPGGEMPSKTGKPGESESGKPGTGKSDGKPGSGKPGESKPGAGKPSGSGEGSESSESGSEGSSESSQEQQPTNKPGGKKPPTGAKATDPTREEPMPSQAETPSEQNGNGEQGGGGNQPKPEGQNEGTPSDEPMADQPQSPQNQPGNQQPAGKKPGQSGQKGPQGQSQQGQGQGQGQPGGKPGSDGPPKSGQGGNQSGGSGTATGHGPQSDSDSPQAGSDPASQTPEQIDLENRKKAIGLQIKQLQDELSRGEVPEDLQDTGYSAEELEAFLRQLDQQLHNTDSTSPEAVARQRQFEELLKGVEPSTQGELKSGATGERAASESTGGNRRPTPKRFQSSEEAFRKRMQKAP